MQDTAVGFMPYHKGPGVKKSGPKGPMKAKGDVLDLILKAFEDEPQLPAHAIARRVKERTGVRLTERRIQQIRHEVGEKRYSRRSGTAAAAVRYPATPASRSLSRSS